METRWIRADDDADWLDRALALVDATEAAALAARGVFHMVLAGGATPRRVYEALARQPRDWSAWRVWFGDERCLPGDHPDRNSYMAAEAWLDKVAMPGTNVRPIPAELGPAAGAEAYARTLAGVGDFDLVLLGLGEDGHTASLFPAGLGEAGWGEAPEAADALAVYGAPKPPPERVSLSAHRLSRARRVLFLVTGAGKRMALAAWRRGERIPAAAIRPAAGVDVLMDAEASGEIG